MISYTDLQKRTERLATGELKEICELLGKGEALDAWIKLGFNPGELKELEDELERATLLNNIANYLYNGKA